MGTGLITAAALRRFAVLFGLFTFLPLCLIVALGLYALDLEEGYRQEREARALTATLESIVRRIDSPGFLRQRFTAFASALMRNGMTPTSIDRAIRSAHQIRTALVDACRDHVGGTAWQDDVTPVILKRTETTCEVVSA